MTAPLICFAHGQESGPWGTKIRALAALAREAGWRAESLDYRGMADPRARAERLVEFCMALHEPPVLVGSSMGGFVSVAAAARVRCTGLVLLAPALYLPGYEEHLPEPPRCPTLVIHGWRDDVVPWDGSVRYAAASGARLLVVDGDHRLTDSLSAILPVFGAFLAERWTPPS